MKSLAGSELLKTGIPAQQAVRYSLSLPIDTLVTGIDSIDVLTQNLEIARSWEPMKEDQTSALLDQIAPYAGDGHLERYKTV